MNITRSYFLLELISKLHSHQSRCGETHIQKTVFFAHELLRIPVSFEFTLYKYGPYSFELSEELSVLRAYNYLKVIPQQYGVSIIPTDNINPMRTLANDANLYEPKLDFIAKRLGSKKVSELEKLSTVLYIKKRLGISQEDAIANKLNELKPHIDIFAARMAVEEFSQLEQEINNLYTNDISLEQV
ncbi:MAG: hypothetical protein ACM3SM_15435 [Bacteroidota bacterium]